jgi:hypothetical protein
VPFSVDALVATRRGAAVDDLARDVVIKIGGPLPVIGTTIAVTAFLTWGAYKLHEGFPLVAALLGGVAAVGVIAALTGIPAAQQSCRNLFADAPFAYENAHCEMLVHCKTLLAGLNPDRSCS